ncbi:MAG: hypothetical protein OIN88_16270, partial [Candidatus Methanoperedens sp.]|nr:hypothetical protein [Candidatus Methanoperedens sp.]
LRPDIKKELWSHKRCHHAAILRLLRFSFLISPSEMVCAHHIHWNFADGSQIRVMKSAGY